ncbi:MAG: hypothetical protein ACOYN0_03600 [Phycisphaerales bacterium]
MARNNMDRGRASKLAGTAQVALGAALLVGVAGAALLGGGEAATPSGPLMPVELPPLVAHGTSSELSAEVDHIGIAERLAVIGNAPKKAPPPEQPPLEAEQPAETPAPTETQGIEYLGQVGLGSGRMALVRYNDAQRIVSPSDVIGPFTITEITHLKLVVEESGARREVDLKVKSADVLTHATTAADGGAMNAAKMGMNASAAAAMRRAADAARMARQNAGKVNPSVTQGKPNSPQGYEARYNAVLERLKESGQFQNEEDLAVAAKRLINGADGNK